MDSFGNVDKNARREEVIRLLRLRKTSSEVAKELGMSRNAVIGIKNRYNQRHADKIGITKSEMTKMQLVQKKIQEWRGRPQPKEPTSFEITGVFPPGAKQLHRLKENQCRYAVTPHGFQPQDHRFCGQPTQENSPYCPHHHSICRETVNARKGKYKSDPSRGTVRKSARLSYYY